MKAESYRKQRSDIHTQARSMMDTLRNKYIVTELKVLLQDIESWMQSNVSHPEFLAVAHERNQVLCQIEMYQGRDQYNWMKPVAVPEFSFPSNIRFSK